MIPWSTIVTIVVAIFGSTGFWTWLTQQSKAKEINNSQLLEEIKLVTQSTKDIKKDVETLQHKIDQMESDNAKRDAVNARVRILAFNDELLRDQRHSKESFDQVLSDIDEYERYCSAHPLFKNNKTKLSVEHITNSYRKAETDHNFL